jgi:hypothetical protein
MTMLCKNCNERLINQNHIILDRDLINYYQQFSMKYNIDYCIYRNNYYIWCKSCCHGTNGRCTLNCYNNYIFQQNLSLLQQCPQSIFTIQPKIFLNNGNIFNYTEPYYTKPVEFSVFNTAPEIFLNERFK